MKRHLELRAAEMRAKATEQRRADLWATLERKRRSGKLTDGEVAQAHREFWEAAAADELAVRQDRRQRNHEATKSRRGRAGGKRSANG